MSPKTERIYGTGDMADQWADINIKPGVRDVVVGISGLDEAEAALLIASRLIVAWSLTDDQEQPIPITNETVGAADGELVWPVLKRIRQLPFLASLGK
jgi:hypothetical protein